jgi:carbamoylphosphate synthase large subunit
MKTILLLSGGNLVGQNILGSLDGRRNDIRLIATNSKPDEAILFSFDKVYLSPPLTTQPDEFEALLRQILVTELPDLVIPCRDEDVNFLARLSEHNPEWKNILLCGTQTLAEAMVDKEKSARLCFDLGIPFAKTILASDTILALEAFFNQFPFPIIAKPVRGFASQGVYLLLDRRQADYFIGRNDYIFQRYIGDKQDIINHTKTIKEKGLPLFYSFEQEKISVQGNISPAGLVIGTLVTIHSMSGGKSNKVTRSTNLAWDTKAKEWVQSLANAGWRGPVNIQCQVDTDGTLVAYELNGRFTGATHARLFFGFDEVMMTLNHWCKLALPQAEINETCQTVQKTTQHVCIDNQKVDRLINQKVWP